MGGMELRPYQQEAREAVEAQWLEVLRTLLVLPTGTERLKIIELVYWKQSHTLYGAAQAVGYSYQHASFLNRQFLIMVAQNLGLEEKSNTRAKNP